MLVSGLVLSGCSSMASARHFSSVSSVSSVSSAGLTCPSAQVCSSMLDSAAEQMMVWKDFQTALETCDRGLESLPDRRPVDPRCAELKAGFCILGIQALAEMNQWQKVLTWILRYYQDPDQIPAEIMRMCIVLHSKVGQPALMQDAARLWLSSRSNRSLSGFGTVAELFLLHVLLPLGQKQEALELIRDAGSSAFTEDQRRAVLELLAEKERRAEDPPLNPETSPEPVSSEGSVLRKLESMLRSLYRKLFETCSGSSSLQRLLLAVLLLYMLALRLDPALPSSFMWISKLLQLLRGVWRAMFAPYHRAVTQSKGL